MSQPENERPRERERDGGGGGAGGGLQRARADGANGRVAGRPLVQRTRNASFAIPKMRSPSFMQKEKEEEIPDANASPWGVEDDRKAEPEKTDAKALADKHIQSRVSRKMSGMGLPSSPTASGISFTSPKARERERGSDEDGKEAGKDGGKQPAVKIAAGASNSPSKKAIRKSMSRFGGAEEMQGIGEFAAGHSHSPGSTMSSTSSSARISPTNSGKGESLPSAGGLDDSGSNATIRKTKSGFQIDDGGGEAGGGGADDKAGNQKSMVSRKKSKGPGGGDRERKGDGKVERGKGGKPVGRLASRQGERPSLEKGKSGLKSRSSMGRKASEDKGAAGVGKRGGVQISAKEKDYDGPSDDAKGKGNSLGKTKSKKFGFSLGRRHKGAGQDAKGEADDAGGAKETEKEEDGAGEAVGGGQGSAGAAGGGPAFGRELSIRQDDFVSYQTKPAKQKGRKSLGIFLQHNED